MSEGDGLGQLAGGPSCRGAGSRSRRAGSVRRQAAGIRPRRLPAGAGAGSCAGGALPPALPTPPWQPATAPGVRSFLTTSQVPELIWELFISCQKTALPAKKTTLAAERPKAWYEGSPGLNHKAPAVWLESKAGQARGGGAPGGPCHMVALKSQGGSKEGFLHRS